MTFVDVQRTSLVFIDGDKFKSANNLLDVQWTLMVFANREKL